jgi:hypothetical protein
MPDLTGIPALDLLIGLSFIYLLLSLFCSTIQEWIAAMLALRASMLEKGLRNMLDDHGKDKVAPKPDPDDPDAQQPLAVQVLGNPIIRTLYRDTRIGLRKSVKFIGRVENRAPSYIAPRAFALALVDTLHPGLASTDDHGKAREPHDVVKALRSAIVDKKWLPVETKKVLLRVIDDGRGDIDRVRENIEAWFDDSMARVSGWYRRKAQLVLCVIAFFVVVGMNADSLVMGQTMWKDAAVRSHVVAAANGAANSTPPISAGGKSVTDQTQALEDAAKAVDNVKTLGVPLGWNNDKNDPRNLDSLKGWLGKVVGLFLTFVALSLGAPFWFDTLSRLSRLRSSGKPETPLPASSAGKPRERVPDPAPPGAKRP